MGLFNKFKRAVGLKNKYALRELHEGGALRGAVLLTDAERQTLGRAERQERFRRWREEQGI
jgi:hypothetical protein